MTLLTIGSCFAGIGGIDLGLESTGRFNTVWHSEIDRAARRVFAARFPNSQLLGDIRTITYGLLTPPEVDVLAGGPPCQGVSIANSQGRPGLADPRSGLFHAYADLVATLQPRWVVMEQVTGLLTSGDPPGADWATVQKAFADAGYATAVRIVNSLTYVPQTRERLIIVGNRDPDACERALLPITRDGARHIGEDRAPKRKHPPETAKGVGIYRKSRRAADGTDFETWVTTDYANTLTIQDTLARSTVLVVDETGLARILTPQEWEGAHGFPAGWTLPAGSDWLRYKLLGNAVSPPVAQRVGVGILAWEDSH